MLHVFLMKNLLLIFGAFVAFMPSLASAGTVHYLTLEEIKRSIREAGWEPRQRNVFYQLIDEKPGPVGFGEALRDTSLPVLN